MKKFLYYFFAFLFFISSTFADYSFDFTNGNFPEGYKKGWRVRGKAKFKKNIDAVEVSGASGTFFMYLIFEPDSEYQLTVEGEGDCDITFCNRQFAWNRVNFKDVFKDSKTFTATLKISADLPEEYTLHLHPKGKNNPFKLIKMSITEKGEKKYLKLDRIKLRKTIPTPDTARAVVLRDFSKNKIDSLKKIGTKFIWLNCDSDVDACTKNLDILKNSEMKAIVDLSSLEKSQRILVYSKLKDFSDNIWAWSLFSENDSVDDSAKLLADFRKHSKDWVIRKIKTSELSKDKRLDDYNVIYCAEVKNEKDLKLASTFVNITPAPFLAIGDANMVAEFESRNMNWAVADFSHAKKVRRFLVKSASKDFQFADLLRVSRTVSPDALNVLFVTDIHYHSVPNKPYARSATALYHVQDMVKAARELKLDLILCGGDVVTGIKDRAENIADISAMYKGLEVSGVPVIFSIGNHDDAGSYWLKKDPKLEHMTTGKDWHDLCVAPVIKKGGVGDELFPDANYYYFDSPKQKIRIINIAALENPLTTDSKGRITYDSNSSLNMSEPQLKWLARKALDFSDKPDANEWGIILLSHSEIARMPNGELAMGILKAFQEGGKYNGKRLKGNYPAKVSCDFTKQGAMKIIAALEGHVHYDAIEKSKLGYPRLQFLNDKNHPEWITSPNRHLGEADDASWSILSIDRKTGKIKMFRFGAGCDAVVEF